VDRELFARGLAEDGEAFGLSLLGGDTTSTPGPLTVSITMLGWVPEGGMVKRSGARPGDLLAVSGTIGDGYLGLKAARGQIDDAALAERYRLPRPRLDLRDALKMADAAADISDGVLADAGHIGTASGCGVAVELEKVPLSPSARRWVESQPDETAALLALATGGDDYEIVCAAGAAPSGFTVVGTCVEGEGVSVSHNGKALRPTRLGYQHADDFP
jgi:thiamine-monophosphate kinase